MGLRMTSARLRRFFANVPSGKVKNTCKLLRNILKQAVQEGAL